MQSELVSVISPCYNVAPYIGRFLDSLLEQTYKNLEIILVNDGATDSTGEIIESYLPRLEEEGYKVVYIVQENGGQSSAVNAALKLVTGSFLTWPDPDDWLTPDSIEKRLRFLQEHPEVGMVRCNIEMIDEQTGKSLGFFERLDSPCLINDAFNKLVFARTWFGAMACMVRMTFFDSVVSGREIYANKRAGQNWQMMLPMAAAYPFWQLPEVLGYYCVRPNSHSRSQADWKESIAYSVMSEEVLENTLTRMHASVDIITAVHKQYAILKFNIAKMSAPFRIVRQYFLQCLPFISGKERLFLYIKLYTPPMWIKLRTKLKALKKRKHK